MGTTANPARRIWRFYRDGFREMTWGRTLWLIILLKLAVMFLVLRMFFFRPALAGMTPDEKRHAVGRELEQRAGASTGDAAVRPAGTTPR